MKARHCISLVELEKAVVTKFAARELQRGALTSILCCVRPAALLYLV